MRADEASLIMYRRLHLDLPELKKLSSFVSDAPSNLTASHHLIENRFDSPPIHEVTSWSLLTAGDSFTPRSWAHFYHPPWAATSGSYYSSMTIHAGDTR